MVSDSEYPLQRVLGEEVGKFMLKEHEAHGVKYHGKTLVKEVLSENGKVKGVKLSNGQVLEADMVLVGVGV